MEKVKVSPDVAKALDHLRHKRALDSNEIFYWHKDKLLGGGWKAELYKPLNNISLDAMYEILTQGYEASTDRPTPKTPRQMNPIIALHQKEKQQQSTAEALQAELDYELASLHHAINEGDTVEIERSKQRLTEIHEEMEGLGC